MACRGNDVPESVPPGDEDQSSRVEASLDVQNPSSLYYPNIGSPVGSSLCLQNQSSLSMASSSPGSSQVHLQPMSALDRAFIALREEMYDHVKKNNLLMEQESARKINKLESDMSEMQRSHEEKNEIISKESDEKKMVIDRLMRETEKLKERYKERESVVKYLEERLDEMSYMANENAKLVEHLKQEAEELKERDREREVKLDEMWKDIREKAKLTESLRIETTKIMSQQKEKDVVINYLQERLETIKKDGDDKAEIIHSLRLDMEKIKKQEQGKESVMVVLQNKLEEMVKGDTQKTEIIAHLSKRVEQLTKQQRENETVVINLQTRLKSVSTDAEAKSKMIDDLRSETVLFKEQLTLQQSASNQGTIGQDSRDIDVSTHEATGNRSLGMLARLGRALTFSEPSSSDTKREPTSPTVHPNEDIKQQSRFSVHLTPSTPNKPRLQTDQAVVIKGYERVDSRRAYMDCGSGEYTTPKAGRFEVRVDGRKYGEGNVDWFLCRDVGTRELLETIVRDGHGFTRHVEWECGGGIHVWVEALRKSGDAEVRDCQFHGRMV